MTKNTVSNVGLLLRDWRQRRRLSQLELVMEADVSSRHLSFVETGRARPSRELLLDLADHLDVPLRQRNELLLAAGYAPVYSQRPLEADAMSPVREALDRVLAGHEPFPALIVDSRWDLVSANAPALAVFTDGVAPEQLAPPVNVLRLALHPEGLAPRILNLTEVRAHLLFRLRRRVALTGDGQLADLLEELSSYPEPAASGDEQAATNAVFVPLRIRYGGHELSFFSTLATFDTPLDVTVAELLIEACFPADAATAALFASAWSSALAASTDA